MRVFFPLGPGLYCDEQLRRRNSDLRGKDVSPFALLQVRHEAETLTLGQDVCGGGRVQFDLLRPRPRCKKQPHRLGLHGEPDLVQRIGNARGIRFAGLDQDIQISGDTLRAVVLMLNAQAAYHHEPHLHGQQCGQEWLRASGWLQRL